MKAFLLVVTSCTVQKQIECKVSLSDATTVGTLHARIQNPARASGNWMMVSVCLSQSWILGLWCMASKSVGSFNRGARAQQSVTRCYFERPRPGGDLLRGPATPMETKSRLKVTARRGPGLPPLPAQSNARVHPRLYPSQIPALCTRTQISNRLSVQHAAWSSRSRLPSSRFVRANSHWTFESRSRHNQVGRSYSRFTSPNTQKLQELSINGVYILVWKDLRAKGCGKNSPAFDKCQRWLDRDRRAIWATVWSGL